MIAQTLDELGIVDYVLNGEPTTEEEFLELFKKIVGEDENGEAILSSDPEDFGITWEQIENAKDEAAAAIDLRFLRMERDKLLNESDWIVAKSTEAGESVPEEWQTYRQALRDITDNYTSTNDVVWPEKP